MIHSKLDLDIVLGVGIEWFWFGSVFAPFGADPYWCFYDWGWAWYTVIQIGLSLSMLWFQFGVG